MRKLQTAMLASLVVLPCTAGQRTTVSLDGNWDIADSVSPTEIPTVFTHKAPVPGLAPVFRHRRPEQRPLPGK